MNRENPHDSHRESFGLSRIDLRRLVVRAPGRLLGAPFMVWHRAMATSPGLAPLLVVAVLLCPLLAGIQPVGGDPDLMYRPIKQELARQLRAGTLPFWSDHFGL